MRKRMFFLAPLAILGLAFFVALGGAAVLYLWNWLLPSLFGFPQITFWQGLGLLALSRILFGGWSSSSPGSRLRHRIDARIDERCAAMTPEEREHFRERIRERWGFAPRRSEEG